MIEETDIFLNTNDFASDAAVAVKGSSSFKAIKVIFNEAGTPVDINGFQIISTTPVAEAKTSDVESLTQNARLRINGVTYYIDQNLRQGDGFNKLILSRDEC